MTLDMIDHSNLEDYMDPVIYDAENAAFEPDGLFYLGLAQRLGGPILELGCGTGRITIPIAQHGIDITGLDIVPTLLQRARYKAHDLPIQWVEADMRTFDLDRQFRLICATGGAFQMLLARHDQEATLSHIRAHLHPDGCFALDLAIPQPAWMRRVDEAQEWATYMTEDGRSVRVTGTEYYDPIWQIKHETIMRQWQTADGQVVTQRSRHAFRYIFPQELEVLLHYNGFRVSHCYGDAALNPLTMESQRLYYLCQLSDQSL